MLHAFLPDPDAGGPIPTGIISGGAEYNAGHNLNVQRKTAHNLESLPYRLRFSLR